MSLYQDALGEEKPKKSRKSEILRLAMELLALSTMDDVDENGYSKKDGTGPEIYVAPRVTPSP